MQLSDFDYNLPKELIAQTPLQKRDNSRLLIVDKENGQLSDKKFGDIVDILGKNDVLVINKTRVINARLKGYIKINKKSSVIHSKTEAYKGQREVEIFLHKQISNNSWDCLVYPGKKLKVETKIEVPVPLKRGTGTVVGEVKSISQAGRIVEFNKGGIEFLKIIEKVGEVPLPPYIKEKLENKERYQTVYNEKSGSVAAPTAGLHFTKELLKKLEKKGVKIEKVLLHVGLGTFKNVKTENIKDHKMHKEYIELKKDVAERLNKYKKQGKKIISVGTTSTRVLESFINNDGKLDYGKKETDIFIYPGYKWKFVDNLITNFHLPKSTLLMLVSSLAGKENIKKAYNYAIKNKYRFFSFGDAMMIK